MYSTDWSASFTSPDASTYSSGEGSVSSSPSGSTLRFSSTTSFPTVAAQVVKVQLPFSLNKGNRFPGIWEDVMVDPIVTAVFGGRGSLVSACLSSFHAARRGWSSWLDAHHPLYEPAFTCIHNEDPHRSNHASSLPSVLAVSSQYILTGVSRMLWKMYPKLSYILTQSLFKRIEFFAEHQMSWWHHSVCLTSTECYSG